MSIIIAIEEHQILETAASLRRILTPETLALLGFHGDVTEANIRLAFIDTQTSWLRKYLEGVVCAALENLPKAICNPDSKPEPEMLLSLVPGLVDVWDLSDGCYCGECLKVCTPVWSSTYDAWEPACHRNGEVIANPARGGVEADIDDILAAAAENQVSAYERSSEDLRETAMQHS